MINFKSHDILNHAKFALGYPFALFFFSNVFLEISRDEIMNSVKIHNLYFFLISKKFYSRRLEVHKACTQMHNLYIYALIPEGENSAYKASGIR